MPYEVRCPNGHKIQVEPSHFGKDVRCPKCKEPFRISTEVVRAAAGRSGSDPELDSFLKTVAGGDSGASPPPAAEKHREGRPSRWSDEVKRSPEGEEKEARGSNHARVTPPEPPPAPEGPPPPPEAVELSQTSVEEPRRREPPARRRPSAEAGEEAAAPEARPAAGGWLGPESRRWAQPTLLAGLLLVLLSRGWDALGERGVARARARPQLAETEFEQEWEDRRFQLREELERLEEIEDPDSSELRRIDELKEKLQKLPGEQTEAREELQRGYWRELRKSAATAAEYNAVSAWWRSWLFLLGTLALSVGLLVVGFTGEGAERWICLAIVAIIAWSIYVGGAAWADPSAVQVR